MNFDKIAPFYTLLELICFGSILQLGRSELLKVVFPYRSKCLLLGEGRGQLLKKGLNYRSDIEWYYTDCSKRMLECTKNAMGDNRVNYYNIDWLSEDKFFKKNSFDFVFAPYFFSCFSNTEVENLVVRVSPLIKSGGQLRIIEFTSAEELKGMKALCQKLLLSLLYRFFKFLTGMKTSLMPNYKPILMKHGFKAVISPQLLFAGMLSLQIYEK